MTRGGDSDGPLPGGPLDPTFSPSREGSTPAPDSAGSGSKSGSAWDRASRSGGSGGSASGGSSSHSGRTPPPHVGRVLGGRWQVGERIGTGGMAAVHMGLDLRLERPVACKILHAHVAESPEARERLAREARAIAQLKHENVIEVYDYSIDDPDCTWLVTELMEGQSLRQVLERHTRPMPEVGVMLALEVVRALRAAHEVGVIHRDVKPDNVLVGREGRPKLSDFGIAKVLNEAKMTMTGNLVGSPSYMSPEQADGLHTDHRTDLYSAGILLYRLVTGTLPFRGSTPIETIRRVSRGEYADPVDIAPECAGPIAGIIRKALTLAIEERYQTADEMLHDLGLVLQDAGLSTTSEELPKFFADPVRYQTQLRPRLARELEARGKALLEIGEETRAVDCFNRALSLGEGSQRTLDLVRELSKRRGRGRVRRVIVAAAAAVAAIATITVVLAMTDFLSSGTQPVPAHAAESAVEVEALPLEERPTRAAAEEAPKASAEAPKALAEAPKALAEAPSREPVAAEPPPEEVAPAPSVANRGRSPRGSRASARSEPPPRAKAEPVKVVEAPPPADETPSPSDRLYGTLHVGTKIWVDVYVDGAKVGRAPDRTQYPLTPGLHRVRAVKPDSDCIPFEREVRIAAGETKRLRLEVDCP